MRQATRSPTESCQRGPASAAGWDPCPGPSPSLPRAVDCPGSLPRAGCAIPGSARPAGRFPTRGRRGRRGCPRQGCSARSPRSAARCCSKARRTGRSGATVTWVACARSAATLAGNCSAHLDYGVDRVIGVAEGHVVDRYPEPLGRHVLQRVEARAHRGLRHHGPVHLRHGPWFAGIVGAADAATAAIVTSWAWMWSGWP